MTQITYPQFLGLVATAAGTFSYRFQGMTLVCNPVIYTALHWPNGIPERMYVGR